MATIKCPFCLADADDAASVCQVCNRDIAVPPSLVAEYEALMRKRDRLLAELADARHKLQQRRRKTRIGQDEAGA
jgi:hypothetical protein